MILKLNKQIVEDFEVLLKQESIVYEKMEESVFIIPRCNGDKWEDVLFELGIKYRMLVENFNKKKDGVLQEKQS